MKNNIGPMRMTYVDVLWVFLVIVYLSSLGMFWAVLLLSILSVIVAYKIIMTIVKIIDKVIKMFKQY